MSEEEGVEDAPVVVQKKKRRLPKPVRNILISAGILFVLLLGVGVLYTYYMDQSGNKTPIASATTVAQQNPTQVKPVQPAASAPEGASVELISSPVSQGSNASITVQTLQNSKCTISVVYGKVPAVDSGLVPKVPDAYGSVSWSWTVSPTAPIGTWPVNVTCVRNGKTGFVQSNLQVTK